MRPAASSYNALRTMQANRRVSGLERRFRGALWAGGVRGYRLHAKLPGRPDLVFGRVQLALFIHGCFWHQCPKGHLPAPKANGEFWAKKFSENRLRDDAAVEGLEALGWNVVIMWECDLRKDMAAAVDRIRAWLQ